MSLRVLAAGLLTLPVARGCRHRRSVGLPIGGAADSWSYRVGNALVGNFADEPALELTLSGPTLLAEKPVWCVVTGAPFTILAGGERIEPGTTFSLAAGRTLTITATPCGARGYLCVAGGIAAPLEVPIRVGEVLATGASSGPRRSLPAEVVLPLSPVEEVIDVPVLPGPHFAWYPQEGFFGPVRTIATTSDRMGVRLAGEALPSAGREIVSEPVVPGTIQVTNAGELIILGCAGQTIGGYPKLGYVPRYALDLIGRLRPGSAVRFTRIDVATARERLRRQQRLLSEWLLRLACCADGVVRSPQLPRGAD